MKCFPESHRKAVDSGEPGRFRSSNGFAVSD